MITSNIRPEQCRCIQSGNLIPTTARKVQLLHIYSCLPWTVVPLHWTDCFTVLIWCNILVCVCVCLGRWCGVYACVCGGGGVCVCVHVRVGVRARVGVYARACVCFIFLVLEVNVPWKSLMFIYIHLNFRTFGKYPAASCF